MRGAGGIAPEGVDTGAGGEDEDERGERAGEFAEIGGASSAGRRHGRDFFGESGFVGLAGQRQGRLGGEDALSSAEISGSAK